LTDESEIGPVLCSVGEPRSRMPDQSTVESKELTWSVHLAALEPRKVAVIVVAAVFAGFMAHWLLGNIFFTIFGGGMVLASTSEFLLPSHYKVSEQGASSRWGVNVTSIRWEDVKRIRADEKGMKLSPFAENSRLEAFRGVYLRFANNRQEVEDAVRYWYKNHEIVG
jgi:hypothetical protein